MPAERSRACTLLAPVSQKGAKVHRTQIGYVAYSRGLADVTGEESQELAGVALISFDGIVRKSAFAGKGGEPGLALVQEIGFSKCQDFGHTALHSMSRNYALMISIWLRGGLCKTRPLHPGGFLFPVVGAWSPHHGKRFVRSVWGSV